MRAEVGDRSVEQRVVRVIPVILRILGGVVLDVHAVVPVLAGCAARERADDRNERRDGDDPS